MPIPEIPSRIDDRNAVDRLTPFRVQDTDNALHGVLMVAAIANWLNDGRNPKRLGPVYRAKLREVFFDYFGRDTLASFSDDLDADFEASLNSAVELDFVLEANPDAAGYEPHYAGGWVPSRA